MPLDQLDKLLRTKDISYCSYSMNTLAGINLLAWGLYHMIKGTVLSIPNFAGLACEIVLVIGCLYANNVIGDKHPLVSFGKLWVYVLFSLPMKLLGVFGIATEEVQETTKQPEEKIETKKS